MAFQYIDTPIGVIGISASAHAVTSVSFIETSEQEVNIVQPSPLTELAAKQLNAYFARELKQFTLPLAPVGTVFQQGVWQQLRRIPYATTCSYTAIAQLIKQPKAVRAVGAANGRNPIAIIVPCHRVIGANGKLTGYAGGLERKAWLLKHEQHQKGAVLL
ncbi:methylated-DNA--[protein]-cysteine S-methyltransferase [Rheinheimera sp. WS51]|uniref:methylated-DNA--[protein]-cysteine S-methyltransferase n=1 Tax=Rheinheimera sp. WS51 TaxID=3425886 RepID=UPI003D8FDB1C